MQEKQTPFIKSTLGRQGNFEIPGLLGNMKQLDPAIPARHYVHIMTAKNNLLASYTTNILSTQLHSCLIYYFSKISRCDEACQHAS